MGRYTGLIALIDESGLFDRAWYRAQYPDVDMLGLDPVEHYLRLGAQLLRNPGAGFDTRYYLATNPDIRASGINPLVHYVTNGSKEGRQPRPLEISLADSAEGVDVIIPVYNALDSVQPCLAAVRSRRDGLRVRAIVVNDGSDAATSDWLRGFCRRTPGFELIEHAENLGYTRAVNTGLRAATAEYVVLLNSDTIVTHGWLKGLVRCMNARPAIGIAGPLSNAASWQSVPLLLGPDGQFAVNDLPVGWRPEDMAEIVAETARQDYPAVPFVNGFCLMIRRDLIRLIGHMDDENFPLGYGEENDYCLRARAAGFELAIADDVYVFHAKSQSFGHERRRQLSEDGARALKRKHTAERVANLVQALRDHPDLGRIRAAVARRLAERLAAGTARLDMMSMRILFLLPIRGGGGGAHSVIQEASEMRRLGIDARVAVRANHLPDYHDLYRDVRGYRDLFLAFADGDLPGMAAGFDIVIATIFTSVVLLGEIAAACPHILPAYYVQDYEPLFFPEGSDNWRAARDSYALVPDALLFAKTRWIADTIRHHHGLTVHKVEPSLDHDVYRPMARPYRARIRIAAMIRPQTPRRGAERCLRVLARLAAAHAGRLSIELFGCKDDHAEILGLLGDVPYRNHGVLKRREVAALLADCDLFLDLSDYQAFGRTGIEAMASGCVAVVPVHGGTDEYAVNGVNALVVDSLDEDGCVERLDALLRAPDKIGEMQQAGLLTASRYSIHAAAVSELVLFARQLRLHRAKRGSGRPGGG